MSFPSLLADECVHYGVIHFLRAKDVDVMSMLDGARGLPDDEVLALANQEDRFILTYDKDFGTLIYRNGFKARGIILIRPGDLKEFQAINAMDDLMSQDIDWSKPIFVSYKWGRIKIRPL